MQKVSPFFASSPVKHHTVVDKIVAERALDAHKMVAVVANTHELEVMEIGVDGNHVKAIVGFCSLDVAVELDDI